MSHFWENGVWRALLIGALDRLAGQAGFGGGLGGNDRFDRFARHFVQAFRVQLEELSEPKHALDVGLRRGQPEPCAATLLPIEQHAEKAARYVLDISHVDRDGIAVLAVDQAEQAFPQQGEIGTVPDLHFAHLKEMKSIPDINQHPFEAPLNCH